MKIALFVGVCIAVGVFALSALLGMDKSVDESPELSRGLDDALVINVAIPRFLQTSFPNTDFSTANEVLAAALSGGPPKDGIPAIDVPAFVPLTTFGRPDEIEAIVMDDGDSVKVYPYNILTWHEIVNDTVDGVPVSITFCPLCGSAVVFERTIEESETTFGVSGGLLESNMLMFDRATESIWQQSTGRALAGAHVGKQLALAPFQLMTLGEVRVLHPEAQVLSEDTGFVRDYGRNPYSGYDENQDQFAFGTSPFPDTFLAKEIMVVWRVGEQVAAAPWSVFDTDDTISMDVGEELIRLQKEDGELTIQTSAGEVLSFYFEMWFSVSVQHGDDIVVYTP